MLEAIEETIKMTTIISPNIKKVSERINPSGDVINPATKQIIVPNVIETVNPEDMIPKDVSQETASEPKSTSKIDEMISKKIEEIINKKIEEALGKL